jgi:hypothetical protein
MEYKIFENQLEEILRVYAAYQKQSQVKDLSDLPKNDRQSLVSRGIAAIQRITSSSSVYSNEVSRIIEKYPLLHVHTSSVMGVVQALRDDIKSGHLVSLVEIVHGNLFADFLEMAQHLLDSKYKDAAAVIAGSTLESHLRELCRKNGVDVEETDKNGKVRPKTASNINADLAKANVYTKLDLKGITAWLDLRNKAAHGKYGEYTEDQVALLISGIQNFIVRNPA